MASLSLRRQDLKRDFHEPASLRAATSAQRSSSARASSRVRPHPFPFRAGVPLLIQHLPVARRAHRLGSGRRPNPAVTLDQRQIGAELLFEVFSQRYERGSILVTSNLPFDEWTEMFGSERLTGALLDRLTHHVHILEMNGESYSLNQSQKRRKSPKYLLNRRCNG